MKLKQDFISSNRYSIKAPYKMNPKGICVHNTYNDASAKNELAYMERNNNKVSFHIAVDEKEAIQAIPFNRNAWHAGDGGKGKGNRGYIALEICNSKSGGKKFDKAEENAAEVIAGLLKKFNWGIDKVKKHQDFSGKYCPHRTLDRGWNRFLNMIKKHMDKGYCRLGDKGQKVKDLQNDLIEVGFQVGKYGADGIFGQDTRQTVIAFQNHYKLEVDGIAGKETIAKIKELLEKKDDSLYKVQVGAFSDKGNAEKQAEKLKKRGFNSYIKKEKR